MGGSLQSKTYHVTDVKTKKSSRKESVKNMEPDSALHQSLETKKEDLKQSPLTQSVREIVENLQKGIDREEEKEKTKAKEVEKEDAKEKKSDILKASQQKEDDLNKIDVSTQDQNSKKVIDTGDSKSVTSELSKDSYLKEESDSRSFTSASVEPPSDNTSTDNRISSDFSSDLISPSNQRSVSINLVYGKFNKDDQSEKKEGDSSGLIERGVMLSVNVLSDKDGESSVQVTRKLVESPENEKDLYLKGVISSNSQDLGNSTDIADDCALKFMNDILAIEEAARNLMELQLAKDNENPDHCSNHINICEEYLSDLKKMMLPDYDKNGGMLDKAKSEYDRVVNFIQSYINKWTSNKKVEKS